ncbi:MAG: type I methionyl aminopeptidase [Myxococcota bacterium]
MNRRRSVVLKSPREIDLMYGANQHVAEILALMCEAAVPGISTWDLDQIARAELKKRKLRSPFLGYYEYPATVCASINEEIVHGIPRQDKVLCEGDIIGIDFGVIYKGYVGDSARTIAVGEIAAEHQELIDTTQAALDAAIALCTPEHRLSDIGRIVQSMAEAKGYGVVREFVGHGIGTRMHEDPQVLNYYDGPKPRMRPGLVIAIEPMLNLGTHKVRVLADNWTAVTEDGAWSAHFEDSVAITEAGPRVLSRL